MILQRRQTYLKQGWNSSLGAGLTAMWEFDGNGYDAISGATLTSTGAVTFPTGKIKRCAYFNGGYFTRPNAFSLPNWSMSFWIYPLSTTGSPAGILGTTVDNIYYGIRFNSNRVYYSNGTNPINTYSTNAVIPYNQWTHVCIVLSTGKLYINGVSVPLTGSLNTLNTQIPTYIGVDNYSLTGRLLKGYLEQLATWNRALSETEVLKLYNNGKGFTYL